MKCLILFFAFNLLNGCLPAQNDKLNVSSPIDNGYKPDFFKEIGQDAIDSVPSLGSILVWNKKGIVYEEYFNGANDKTNFKVMSVTKSIVSALIGIANENKLIPDFNTPIYTLLPEYAEYFKEKDTLRRKITLRDLITMQSGYLCNDNDPLNISIDPVINTLELPFETSPGIKFKYCTGASNVLGVIVAKCVKENLKLYADSVLFKPIGVKSTSWLKDTLKRNLGGSGLSMKSMDMMKFGLLYLNEGKVNDKQIISKSWIKESTNEQAKLNEWDVLPGADGYGYYWWRRITNGHQAFVATGFGGQLICIVPDLKVIVVTTCFVNNKNRGRSEIKRLHNIIDKIVKASE